MKKNIKIDIELYNRSLFVTLDEEEAMKLNNRYTMVDVGEGECFWEACGITFYNRGAALIIWLRDWAESRTIAHECAHVAMYMCCDAGIKIDVDNQEPFAYLVGHLVDKVTAAHKKLKEAKE